MQPGRTGCRRRRQVRVLAAPTLTNPAVPAAVLCAQVLACDIDLLHPPVELEKRKHKHKRLVQSPNSYFMDVKCQGCFTM